ncbi:MAG: hypothetical protein KU29_09640 [Sulfurovum sp. FS06-10]|nr:MAG: hypothetical protein KU29_09640 [Sulfurovum sp. FS06-10]
MGVLDEGKTIESLRIQLNSEVVKKISIIASSNSIDGKKQDVISKVIDLAVNHYYKEVTVPELQKLTTVE